MLTSPHNPTKQEISSERENKYLVFLFSFWKGFMGITVLPTVRIYPHMCRFFKMCGFKNFFYFCLWKNRNKMRVYIIWTSMRNFSWNFLIFFQKLPSAYIFIKCRNLWKFVLIVFNTYQNFIKLWNTSKFSEKQVQNLNKFLVKFTQILFKIY